MRILDGQLVLSPSDLANFLTCRHRAGLDLAAARKADRQAALRRSLRRHAAAARRGARAAYVDSLRAQGLAVVDAQRIDSTATLEAMRAGVQVIVQAVERAVQAGYGELRGAIRRRADARRDASDLGAWSYEVQDTKLAKETKGGTILQLSAYSDMVGRMQGRRRSGSRW